MFGWIRALMPREEHFFELFSSHARTLLAGARALARLIEGGAGMAEASAEIAAREDEADHITRDILLAVRRTFITPFDRGDISDLAGLLDDAIDQMFKTSKTIHLFEVTSFAPDMKRMAEIIVAAAERTLEAIDLLSAMRRNTARLNAISEEIIALEEEADGLYDAGRKALFLAHRSGPAMDYIVGDDIFSHLEKVVDRFEDVANRISAILIENV
ncbi:MAG: DUF47 domain-containing protein [Caulobacteraceae bacterium]